MAHANYTTISNFAVKSYKGIFDALDNEGIRKLIRDSDLNGVYKLLPTFNVRPSYHFTEYLLNECKLNPLDYFEYKIPDWAFSGCFPDDKLVVKGSIKIIGKDSFSFNDELLALELQKGVEVIEHDAFAGCTKLQAISLPGTLKRIDDKAFDGVTAVVMYEGDILDFMKLFEHQHSRTAYELFGQDAVINCKDATIDNWSRWLRNIRGI